MPLRILVGLVVVATTVTAGAWYYLTPKYTDVGYMPTQPVPYSHALHVGQLGLDCRYCHTFVDQSAEANLPDAGTCMNCHNTILPDSPALAPIRASYESGEPVDWVRVHRVPDYVYFDHSAHVNRGVSCVECHGQVNEMEVVWQDKPLSMSFCLDCHREPEKFVRPLDKIYDLDWKPESEEQQLAFGTQFVHEMQISPPQSCSGCHR